MASLITSKDQFQQLSMAMRLGNRFRSWSSLASVQASGYTGNVYIRGPVRDWPFMVPSIAVAALPAEVQRIKRARGWIDGITFVEVPGWDTPRTINAEACQSHRYLWLTWGDSNDLSLRHDLEQNGRFEEGLAALMLLRQRVPVEDIDMLQDIWSAHPGCIIEFTTYTKAVGVLNRQTVVWECRNY